MSLAKHTTGKGCLYIRKLADVDQEVLKAMIAKSVTVMRARPLQGAVAGAIPLIARLVQLSLTGFQPVADLLWIGRQITVSAEPREARNSLRDSQAPFVKLAGVAP